MKRRVVLCNGCGMLLGKTNAPFVAVWLSRQQMATIVTGYILSMEGPMNWPIMTSATFSLMAMNIRTMKQDRRILSCHTTVCVCC